MSLSANQWLKRCYEVHAQADPCGVTVDGCDKVLGGDPKREAKR